jgi:hypothetical protein
MTIDSSGLDRIDLIKIDIEGMELEAFSGAIATIRKHKPVLFIETIKIDKTKLVRMLSELDYQCYPQGMGVLGIHADDPIAAHVHVEKRAA